MALTAAQYRTMRDLFRGALSVDSANPDDAAVFSFFNQLLADSAGAVALSSTRQPLADRIAKRLLSGNFSGPTDANVVDFWTALATDANAGSAMSSSTAQYQTMRKALIEQFSCEFFNPSPADILSYFSAYVLINLSAWSTGVYVDTVPGTVGANVGVIPSQSGSNSLTPSATQPKIYANAIDGRNAVFYPNSVPGGPYQYLTCDPCAALLRNATGNWVVAGGTRLDKTGEQPIWGAMRSDGSAAEKWSFRVIAEALVLQKFVGSVIVSTFTGPRLPDPYSTLRWAVVCTAGQITFYYVSSGQTAMTTVVFGSQESTNLSTAVDRFAFGASVSSVPFELFTGYQTEFAVGAFAPTAAQVQWLLCSSWASLSYLTPQASGFGAITPGDSIMLASQDVVTGAGMRDCASELWSREALSFFTYGGIQAGGNDNGYGVGRVGSVRNTFSSCLSGQDIASISAQALLDIANSPAPVAYWLCYMGGGDNNVLVAPATICTRFVAAFTQVMNAMIAKTGTHAFADISPIIPNQNVPIQANLVALYALWTASVVAPLQTAFPGRVYAADCYAALGGVWSATYFGADPSHPLRIGCVQMALHPDYGRIRAKNELGETLGARMRRESPTTPKLATLSGAILSPAPAASLPNATPVVISADCSRIGTKAVFKVDGTVIATMSVVDIYDSVVAFGSYVHTPHNTWTYTWTPGAPMVGARSLTVTFTDLDGTTVATSPAVSVTVT